MLVISFVLLLVINGLQGWQRARDAGGIRMSAARSQRDPPRARPATTEPRLGALDADRRGAGLPVRCSCSCRWPRCSTEALRKGFGAYLAALQRARCLVARSA